MACRYGLLAGAAFCNGFVVGPLVDMALGLHPAMVLTAFLATASIFACFSGAGEPTSMLIPTQTYYDPIANTATPIAKLLSQSHRISFIHHCPSFYMPASAESHLSCRVLLACSWP